MTSGIIYTCNSHTRVCVAHVGHTFRSHLYKQLSHFIMQLHLPQITCEIIKTSTAPGERYVDLLAQWGNGGAVSQCRPFYFISHGWGRPFSELVEMITEHFSPGRQRAWRRGDMGEELPVLTPSEVFLWLDVFALNQHPDVQQVGDLVDRLSP